jgi:hypothetical protein
MIMSTNSWMEPLWRQTALSTACEQANADRSASCPLAAAATISFLIAGDGLSC